MTEPLSPDLVARGLVVWGEVANVMLDHRLERWRRLGLTTLQLRSIGILERAGGSLSAGEMADRLHVSRPVLTRIIDRLEKRGFVERKADPDDGRGVILALRPEGRSVYQDATSWAQAFLRSAFCLMGEQGLERFVTSNESFLGAAERVRNEHA